MTAPDTTTIAAFIEQQHRPPFTVGCFYVPLDVEVSTVTVHGQPMGPTVELARGWYAVKMNVKGGLYLEPSARPALPFFDDDAPREVHPQLRRNG